MSGGYKILWSDHALAELKETIEYFDKYFSPKEIQNLASELEHTLQLISRYPELFQTSKKHKYLRRAVVAKYNNLYYQTSANSIEIMSFFSNRQHPGKAKI